MKAKKIIKQSFIYLFLICGALMMVFPFLCSYGICRAYGRYVSYVGRSKRTQG